MPEAGNPVLVPYTTCSDEVSTDPLSNTPWGGPTRLDGTEAFNDGGDCAVTTWWWCEEWCLWPGKCTWEVTALVPRWPDDCPWLASGGQDCCCWYWDRVPPAVLPTWDPAGLSHSIVGNWVPPPWWAEWECTWRWEWCWWVGSERARPLEEVPTVTNKQLLKYQYIRKVYQ